MNFSSFLFARRLSAFTLVELLVSTAIIALLMLVLVAMTNQTTQTWQYTTEKIEKFQEARDGFESMTRQLSQATLNTYWDYLGIVTSVPAGSPKNNPNEPLRRNKIIATSDYKDFVPLRYGRMSELRFICGSMTEGASPLVAAGDVGAGDEERHWPTHGVFFQAPLGNVDPESDPAQSFPDTNDKIHYAAMNNLLNTWGYFVEIGYELGRPTFINDQISPKRWGSRLMEFRQRSESMALHDTSYPTTTAPALTTWFSIPLKISRTATTPPVRPTRVLAENVTALIILPKLSKQDEDFRTKKTPAWKLLSPNYKYDSTQTLNDGATITNAGDVSDAGGINPKNQLPPIVQVTMVAIDKRSAQRWVDLEGKASTIDNLYRTKGLFLTNSSTLETPGTGDLAQYENRLIAERITYRIFTTNVSIKGAKWSRAQTK